MGLAIWQGFFENRDLKASYQGRLTYYLLMIVLYQLSKVRPVVKDFIPLVLTVFYNSLFIYAPIYILQENQMGRLDQADMAKYVSLVPIGFYLWVVKICLVYTTKFWMAGYIVCPLFILYYYLNIYQHRALAEFESTPNFHFIFWPNFNLMIQAMVTVSYISELNRILIWFYANENINMTRFYEETIQDKIPVVLVSSEGYKGDRIAFNEKLSKNSTSWLSENSFKKSMHDFEIQEQAKNNETGWQDVINLHNDNRRQILQRNQSYVDFF